MKTRAELAAAIPGSGQSASVDNPAVLAVQGAMKDLDAIKAEKEACMAAAVDKVQNFNAVEDLMEAHRGNITREEAFKKQTDAFIAHFQANLDAEEKRKAACGII